MSHKIVFKQKQIHTYINSSKTITKSLIHKTFSLKSANILDKIRVSRDIFFFLFQISVPTKNWSLLYFRIEKRIKSQQFIAVQNFSSQEL